MAEEKVTITKADVRQIFRGWFAANGEPATAEEIASEKYLDECVEYFFGKAVEAGG